MGDDFLQYMFFSEADEGAAYERPMGQLEGEEEEEVVIVDSIDDIPVEENEDDDLPDEVKRESKKSLYEKLAAQKDSSAVLADTLNKGFEKLGQQLKPQAPVVKEEEIDWKQAKEQLNKQIFEGDAAEAIEQFNSLLTKPLQKQLIASEMKTFNVAVKALKVDPKYKDIMSDPVREQEIANTLMMYPEASRRDPDVLFQVVEGIRQKKILEDPLSDPEVGEKLEKRIEEKILERLRKEGKLVEDSGQNTRVNTYASTSRRSSNIKGKKTVYYTQAEKDAADIIGVSYADYKRYYGGKR